MCARSGTCRFRVLIDGLKFGVIAVCGGALFSAVASQIFQWLGLEPEPQDAVLALLRADTPLLTLALIAVAAVVVSPVLEELLFRHFIQRRLVAAGFGKGGSSVAVAVVFAICHWNLQAALPLFVASLLFSAAYFRGGLPCAGIAHATHNIVTIVAALIQAS